MESIKNLNINDPEYYDKLEELKDMDIVADVILIYADIYSKKIENMAKKEKMLQEKKELIEMAEICKRVPPNLPKTFWEALQHHLFMLA